MSVSTSKKSKEKEQQEIVATFQKLREDQKVIASKSAELQIEQKSHELVIETLKEVEKERKCFRMIGGVLVERTVGEVLPALEQNKEQITRLIDNLQSQIVAKGKEINDFREKHNIRFQGENENSQKTATEQSTQAKSSGVLVEKSA
ncbi:prefoldin subunit 2 [Brachionus plicatilis]|uniref:Prefoldin subunit 2 n=1 Tax=Brachionus plicatilis TaxID=10195 RepID=A0A3M7P239_BRAPC|nr:prefoldin subunit 2 [Brachionus plicatilis]